MLLAPGTLIASLILSLKDSGPLTVVLCASILYHKVGLASLLCTEYGVLAVRFQLVRTGSLAPEDYCFEPYAIRISPQGFQNFFWNTKPSPIHRFLFIIFILTSLPLLRLICNNFYSSTIFPTAKDRDNTLEGAESAWASTSAILSES